MNKLINKIKEVDNVTLARTLILFLGLINAGLKLFGKNVLPISDEQINTGVTAIWVVGGSLWAWWKNNSFTKPAIKADAYKDVLKDNPAELAEIPETEETEK